MIAYLVVASVFTCLGFLIAALSQAAKIDALHAEIEALRMRGPMNHAGDATGDIARTDLAA